MLLCLKIAQRHAPARQTVKTPNHLLLNFIETNSGLHFYLFWAKPTFLGKQLCVIYTWLMESSNMLLCLKIAQRKVSVMQPVKRPNRLLLELIEANSVLNFYPFWAKPALLEKLLALFTRG